MSSWDDILHNTKVRDLLQPGKNIISFKYNDPLTFVSNTLSENKILSAPILKDNKPMGFLDTLDMCQWLVHCWRERRDETGQVDRFKLPEKFSGSSAQKFINFSGRNAYHSIKEDETLRQCLEMLHKDEFSIHRLAVHSKENKLIGLISQSDIMQFAANHLDKLPKADKTLKELGLVRPVVMARAEAILGDVLDLLCQAKVSGLALVDSEGKIVTNFSASDLRGLQRAVYNWFDKSTIDFLQHFGRGPKPPIVQSPDTTFKDCAEKLAHLSKERIHRVYLVDEEDRPIGVVSLSDVMPLLLERNDTQEAH
jgi:CBS domain-containing protein